jgi:hypothetical protein
MRVRSRADFRHWFGGSKVAYADGSPRMVFHGTVSCFKEFCAAKRNPELGFHFGSLGQAEFFAGWDEKRRALTGSNIRPVYLRIDNPLRLPDLFERGRRSAENIARWLCRDGLIGNDARDAVYRARTSKDASDRIIAAIRSLGYDGIVYENDQEGGSASDNEDSFVAFEPNQIRSVFC